MENLLLLTAAILCGNCSLLSFFSLGTRMKKLLYLLWGFTAVAIITALTLMLIHLISSDFNYQYVYSHSSLEIGLVYKISALWSGQEGSFLLWAAILAIMGCIPLKYKGTIRSFGIYSAVCFCICLMCFFTAPFEKMDGMFTDGTGLNEALKDPWMVLHPPLVFISYSAMAILFSCTACGKESGYADRLLTWQRISWFFLGLGILSGSIWAYRALGWGGYWAWDPIENAAFVPWLILCGYLHRKDRKGPSACILPFASACFGVFLARSGILKDQSAHAYTSGNILVSIILLLFLAVVLVFLIITGIKNTLKRKVKSGLREIVRRLFFYSINGYAALIFLGTVFPLLFHIIMPVSFYNIISVIFVFAYSLLLLIYDIDRLKTRFLPMILTATAFTAGIIVLAGASRLWAFLIIWCCLLPLSLWLVSGIRPARFAYCLTHTGAILLMIGAISSSVLGKEAFILTGPDHTILQAEGVSVSAEELSKKSMIIKTTPFQDILIKSSESMISPQGAIIPYETKPFIWLFWCGSFILIFQPVLGPISASLRKRKYKTPEPIIIVK